MSPTSYQGYALGHPPGRVPRLVPAAERAGPRRGPGLRRPPEAKGVTLGYPHTSAIKGASVALRELRVQSGGKPIRILYAFDPKRQAVLILGGDKTGDDRFYAEMVPRAEK